MPRLFVALRPPTAIRRALAATMQGVPDARWQDDDQLHLTVRFLGDLDRHQAQDAVAALGNVRCAPITSRVTGVGQFDNALWAALSPREPLDSLHAKVDGKLRTAGLAPDGRAYVPHVTLARLPRRQLSDRFRTTWLSEHAGLASPDFVLDRLVLYESTLGGDGARYEPVAIWPLAGD